MNLLIYDDIVAIHDELVNMFQADQDPIVPAGVRDENLLRSAVERPNTALGTTEKYQSIEGKAAALFHSLIMNHPFHNGNKRTALVSTLVLLDRNNRRIEAADGEVFDFVVSVASRRAEFAGSADEVVENVESWLRVHISVVRHEPAAMRTRNFLESARRAGGRYRQSRDKGRWIVFGPNGDSVTFRCSSKRLTGQVVKRYMHKLGFAEAVTGIYPEEFVEGLRAEQHIIRRFRSVLRRLSHA